MRKSSDHVSLTHEPNTDVSKTMPLKHDDPLEFVVAAFKATDFHLFCPYSQALPSVCNSDWHTLCVLGPTINN